MYFAAVARTPVLLPLLCGLLASGPVSAQSTDTTGGRLVGRVLDDETGKPIAGVSLDLDPGPVRQISDPAGAFLFPAVRQGIHDLTIEHLAYGRITRPVNVPPGASVQLDIRLVPRAVALDSMVVQVTLRDPVMERGGYYDRKRAGWGFFLEGRDLERPVVSDILQNVPRLEVLTGRSRLEQQVRIRKLSVSLTGTNLYCAPEVYLDGLFQRGAADLLDELLTPNQVRAIEVYRGAETPPQFIQGLDLPCGAIVFWTKG